MQCEDGSTDVVLLPLLMGGRRLPVRQPLPRIGEHTAEVLARLSSQQAPAAAGAPAAAHSDIPPESSA
jgi:crotonobetainyl-CoA:carnitine CoA-transferase CaiB-like acyl-CoA transferase